MKGTETKASNGRKRNQRDIEQPNRNQGDIEQRNRNQRDIEQPKRNERQSLTLPYAVRLLETACVNHRTWRFYSDKFRESLAKAMRYLFFNRPTIS
jgi:hypothetical protein